MVPIDELLQCMFLKENVGLQLAKACRRQISPRQRRCHERRPNTRLRDRWPATAVLIDEHCPLLHFCVLHRLLASAARSGQADQRIAGIEREPLQPGWNDLRPCRIEATEPRQSLTTTPAAFSTLLDGRASVRAVRAIHTAVARSWREHRVAVRALVEPLTGIRGHRLTAGKATLGAGQRGLQCDGAQCASPANVDG